MSSTESGIPAGQPSIMTPSAGPWDSPHVVSLNIRPKLLPIELDAFFRVLELLSVCFADFQRTRIDEIFAVQVVIVCLATTKAKPLVEPLRAQIEPLRAQSDPPRTLAHKRLDRKFKRLETESLVLAIRNNRDPVEVPPTAIGGDTYIGN